MADALGIKITAEYQGNHRRRTWIYRTGRGNLLTGDLLPVQDSGNLEEENMKIFNTLTRRKENLYLWKREKYECMCADRPYTI